jgi:hypothetical protein
VEFGGFAGNRARFFAQRVRVCSLQHHEIGDTIAGRLNGGDLANSFHPKFKQIIKTFRDELRGVKPEFDPTTPDDQLGHRRTPRLPSTSDYFPGERCHKLDTIRRAHLTRNGIPDSIDPMPNDEFMVQDFRCWTPVIELLLKGTEDAV